MLAVLTLLRWFPRFAAAGRQSGQAVEIRCSDPVPEQFHSLGEAIQNRRSLEKTLAKMEKLSRQILFGTLPHTRRRKSLPKKVFGLI